MFKSPYLSALRAGSSVSALARRDRLRFLYSFKCNSRDRLIGNTPVTDVTSVP